MISPQKSKVRYYPSMTSNDVYKQAHNPPTQGLGRNTNTWHKPNCKRQHNKHNPQAPINEHNNRTPKPKCQVQNTHSYAIETKSPATKTQGSPSSRKRDHTRSQ